MSDYTQITDFSVKDALNTGDPNKLIVGSQFDAEFAAIATAIASKIETVSEASVTAHQAALSIAETQIPDGAVLARVGSNETISGTWTFSVFPTFTGVTVWRSTNDGAGSGLDADLLDAQQGSYYLDCGNFTGSLADARLSANIPLENGSNTFTSTNNFTGTLQYNSLEVGYKHIPQSIQAGNYTCVLADSGKHLYHAAAEAAATYTIPANASVAYELGTVLTFVNMSANAVTISITTDTLYLAGSGSTGSRTLAQYGIATAIKMTSTTWLISGTGLT